MAARDDAGLRHRAFRNGAQGAMGVARRACRIYVLVVESGPAILVSFPGSKINTLAWLDSASLLFVCSVIGTVQEVRNYEGLVKVRAFVEKDRE